MSSPITIRYMLIDDELNDEFSVECDDFIGELQITFQVQDMKIDYSINFSRNLKSYTELYINKTFYVSSIPSNPNFPYSTPKVNINHEKFINDLNLDNDWGISARMDQLTDTITGIKYDSFLKIFKIWSYSDANGSSKLDIPANENTFAQIKRAIINIFSNCK